MVPGAPKMGPKGPQEGSQIGLPRPSHIEAEKGSASANLSGPFWSILDPSWGPCWAHVGPQEGL